MIIYIRCSDTQNKGSVMCVEEYAYYVNKLRQNIGLKT